MRRSECHQALPSVQAGVGLQPQPGGQHRADVRQARQRRAGGGVAEPGGGHPVRGQPAPGRAGAEPPGGGEPGPPPPRGDRGQPGRLRGQRGGEQVGGCAVVLAAQHQAVDVRRASRTVPASARRAGRAAGVVVVSVMMSWACPVMRSSAFPAVTAASDAPRGHICTGCDDCYARVRAGQAPPVSVSASS